MHRAEIRAQPENRCEVITRGVIGKRIVEIRHAKICGDPSRRPFSVVAAVVLENGVVLLPVAHETEGDVVGSIIRSKHKAKSLKKES